MFDLCIVRQGMLASIPIHVFWSLRRIWSSLTILFNICRVLATQLCLVDVLGRPSCVGFSLVDVCLSSDCVDARARTCQFCLRRPYFFFVVASPGAGGRAIFISERPHDIFLLTDKGILLSCAVDGYCVALFSVHTFWLTLMVSMWGMCVLFSLMFIVSR